MRSPVRLKAACVTPASCLNTAVWRCANRALKSAASASKRYGRAGSDPLFGSASSANRIAASVSPLAAVCCERNESERDWLRSAWSRASRASFSADLALSALCSANSALPRCFLLSSEPEERARAGHESQHRRDDGRIARASREPARCRGRKTAAFGLALQRASVQPRAPGVRVLLLRRPRSVPAPPVGPSPLSRSGHAKTPRCIR